MTGVGLKVDGWRHTWWHWSHGARECWWSTLLGSRTGNVLSHAVFCTKLAISWRHLLVIVAATFRCNAAHTFLILFNKPLSFQLIWKNRTWIAVHKSIYFLILLINDSFIMVVRLSFHHEIHDKRSSVVRQVEVWYYSVLLSQSVFNWFEWYAFLDL